MLREKTLDSLLDKKIDKKPAFNAGVMHKIFSLKFKTFFSQKDSFMQPKTNILDLELMMIIKQNGPKGLIMFVLQKSNICFILKFKHNI